MGFLDHFTTDIGIDLGTCNTLIYVRDKGSVIDEPSVPHCYSSTSHALVESGTLF